MFIKNWIVGAFLPLALAQPVELAPVKRDVNIPDYVAKFKGTTYTPFDENNKCRTEDQIKTDLGVLKDFNVVRLYSADCNVIQYAAETINGKLYLTINNVGTPEGINGDISAMKSQVAAAGKQFNDKVEAVIVGNELLYNKWYNLDQVKGFISQAKNALSGFNGKVFTADVVATVYEYPEMCEFNDVIGINNHPFFDHQTHETAGEYVLGHIQAVAAFCLEHGHDVSVITTETGWPWKGDKNDKAVPSSENQVTALKKISDAAGDDCILYSAYNELWKDGSINGGVEQSWGILGNAPSVW